MNSLPDESEASLTPPGSLCYLNGQFIPFSQARLPLYDAGFVLGATVTDFVRTFRLQLYLLRDHLERFCSSCRLAEVPMPKGIEALTEIAEKLVTANAPLLNPAGELALILVATPGAVPFYSGEPRAQGEPTLAMHTVPLDMQRCAGFFRSGIHLATPRVCAGPKECIDPRIKNRSRLHWRLAQNEVNRSHPGSLAAPARSRRQRYRNFFRQFFDRPR